MRQKCLSYIEHCNALFRRSNVPRRERIASGKDGLRKQQSSDTNSNTKHTRYGKSSFDLNG
jgi:hypothetical protein